MMRPPDSARFAAIASRRGTFDRGANAYRATLSLSRTDSLLMITIDSPVRTEFRVPDVETLDRDLRRLRAMTSPRARSAMHHRIVATASETRTASARGVAGRMYLRRDDEVELVFFAVEIVGRDPFEVGFRDVDGVLAQLRRVAPAGPRLLREILRDPSR